MRGIRAQDGLKVDLQAAPVAEPGQRVGRGLHLARGEQRVVLAEGERHPREHEPERRDGEAERDGVDVQRHGEREDGQRERSESDRDEQAAADRERSRAARGRRERRGPGEADEAGGHERVGDDAAGIAAQFGQVDHIRRHERDDRGAQRHPQAIEPPAREADGADDRAQQHQVTDRIGEVRHLLPERRARRALDRRGHRHAREHRGDRKAAGQAIEARRPERPADAAADQRDQCDVQAGVDREPEWVRDRGDRHGAEVGRQRVDDVAREAGEQAGAQRVPREAVRAAAERAGEAPDRGDEDDGVVHPAAKEVNGSRAAEAGQRVRPDHREQHAGEKAWYASHRRSSGRHAWA